MSKYILETDQRLSRSLLWKLQYEAYCQYGIEAWNQYGVPFYITSNSFTAKSYAHVVLGYLRDGLANQSIDPGHPVYLFDLGAGTGRFAYFFLKELLKFLSSSSLPKIKLCYVMTDIVRDNFDFWKSHSYLKPYFEKGILDCAYYHHVQDEPIHLMNSKIIVSKETLANPIVLICNYFFDTIPQDLFRYKNGRLEEGCMTLFVEGEKPADSDPSVINRLQYHYSYQPVSNLKSYYESPEWNILLESYCQSMEGNSFLFPVGAFYVLSRFMEWSGSRLLLLAGDQGVCTIDQMKQAGDPKVALHGSFSIPVSYHLIAALFRRIDGGAALLTAFSDPSFIVMAGILGEKNEYFLETSLAFHEHLDSFEPADYLKLVSLTEEQWKECPLDQILLLIKLGNWDASVMHTFFSLIRQAIPLADEKQRQLVRRTIEIVWEHFYPTGPSTGDFVLNLGVLLFEMKFYAEAVIYFERSIKISGVNKKALNNIVACRQHLQLE